MGGIDEPRYRDESGRGHSDGHATPRRRATGPARPAWDAATYGVPDDLRRARTEAPVSDWAAPRYPAPVEAAPPEPHGLAPGPYAPTTEPYEPPAAEPYGPPAASPYGPSRAAPPTPPPSSPAYEDGRATSGATEPSRPPRARGRAGRNLPAALATGLVLAALVVASLFVWRPLFLGVLAAFAVTGIWELTRAIRATGVNPPLVPLIAGGVAMGALAWWGNVEALAFGLVITLIAIILWRLADRGTQSDFGRDVTSAMLVAVYVPFLLSFGGLLARPPDGHWRVVVTVATVILSDTGGYVAGVFFGKHRMAPRVSPKKSWEGLAGSLVAAAVGAAVMLRLAFDVPVWQGALFGTAIMVVAVLGDLGESMIKRDLGVKDMSSLLPGHGGIMDRLDSVLLAAPTAYALLMLLAPPG